MLAVSWLAVGTVSMLGAAAPPLYEAQLIFDPAQTSHGHVHASCIVVCPNGDLRAVWYENGIPLPPPYYGGDQDKSSDVRIGGSRKAAGAAQWDAPFVMADTFGVSDNNPCMAIDQQQRLWLVFATLLGVPENSWGSALVRYQVSSDYAGPGVPVWSKKDILPVHLDSFEKVFEGVVDERAQKHGYSESQRRKSIERMAARVKDPLKRRLGWMPRAHPLVKADGTVVLPLANENYSVAAMAMTRDTGKTWTISGGVPVIGVIQPTLVEFLDGEMAAFFRNSRPEHRIVRSDSKDGGMTWSPVSLTELEHPGSGIEAVLLQNGHLLMIYNDKEDEPRDRLAVSISEDRGKSWPWKRHLENTPGQRFDYPSLLQAGDGTLHATYTVNTKAIKYAHFNEAWVREGNR